MMLLVGDSLTNCAKGLYCRQVVPPVGKEGGQDLVGWRERKISFYWLTGNLILLLVVS